MCACFVCPFACNYINIGLCYVELLKIELLLLYKLPYFVFCLCFIVSFYVLVLTM
jgi:hypothetical protein